MTGQLQALKDEAKKDTFRIHISCAPVAVCDILFHASQKQFHICYIQNAHQDQKVLRTLDLYNPPISYWDHKHEIFVPNTAPC